jgi:molybdopterin molybdotransferase
MSIRLERLTRLLSLRDARGQVVAALAGSLPPIERVALDEAHRRVLAVDVKAPIDLPIGPLAACDGYAVRSRDLAEGAPQPVELRWLGSRGRNGIRELPAQACIALAEGEALPAGADAVLRDHEATRVGGVVFAHARPLRGQNVIAAGSECRAGTRLLPVGTRLGPAELALLAAIGQRELRVYRRPRVALLTLGSELAALGEPLHFGQSHDSNRVALAAWLQQADVEVHATPTLPDRDETVIRVLEDVARQSDLIISTGAVRSGSLLPALLTRIGQVFFWKVRMQPGGDSLFGRVGDTPLLALPGAPVAAEVALLTLVAPAVQLLSGIQPIDPPAHSARLLAPLHKPQAVHGFWLAQVSLDETGELRAQPLAAAAARGLGGAAANALITLPEAPRSLAAGDRVRIQYLRDFLH